MKRTWSALFAHQSYKHIDRYHGADLRDTAAQLDFLGRTGATVTAMNAIRRSEDKTNGIDFGD
jgi:hypothetical protein